MISTNCAKLSPTCDSFFTKAPPSRLLPEGGKNVYDDAPIARRKKME
jgi:hypothetical protein